MQLQVVQGHLTCRPESGPALQAAPCFGNFRQASAEDVVVVHGWRTALGKAGRGVFKVRPPGVDEFLSAVLTAVLQDVKLRPEQLGDISLGECTTQALRRGLRVFSSLQSPASMPLVP
uniref:acetyl-CoA C-acetyltransferase n=1 Tax=Marmota marmota marmota TaxID=9994 RepID=A0A8C6ESD7_MARMA